MQDNEIPLGFYTSIESLELVGIVIIIIHKINSNFGRNMIFARVWKTLTQAVTVNKIVRLLGPQTSAQMTAAYASKSTQMTGQTAATASG